MDLYLDASDFFFFDCAATPLASVAVTQKFGRFRERSGHRATIANRSLLTHSGSWVLAPFEFCGGPFACRRPIMLIATPYAKWGGFNAHLVCRGCNNSDDTRSRLRVGCGCYAPSANPRHSGHSADYTSFPARRFRAYRTSGMWRPSTI